MIGAREPCAANRVASLSFTPANDDVANSMQRIKTRRMFSSTGAELRTSMERRRRGGAGHLLPKSEVSAGLTVLAQGGIELEEVWDVV